MEKIANKNDADKDKDKPLHLLRSDSYDYNVSENNSHGDNDYSSSYLNYEYDDEDNEEALFYPKLERALPVFYETMADYLDRFDIDAISSELDYRMDSFKILNRIIHMYEADNDMDAMTKQIDGYVSMYENAVNEIRNMENEGAQSENIKERKAELFTDMVKKFDLETENFGNITYSFALKSLYKKLMKIANSNTTDGPNIFDYFAMSEHDPDVKKSTYEYLQSDLDNN